MCTVREIKRKNATKTRMFLSYIRMARVTGNGDTVILETYVTISDLLYQGLSNPGFVTETRVT